MASSPNRVGVQALLLISIALNLWQAWQINAAGNVLLPKPDEPQVGEILPNLVAVRAGTASQETIPLTGDLPTVIYSFTSVCGWCSSNIDNIRHLASSLAGRYRVIGVSLGPEDPVSYSLNNALGFPVYYQPDPKTASAFRFSRVPHTLVLDSNGRVKESWYGAYAGLLEKEVREFFAIEDFPGLIPPLPMAEPGLRGE